MTGTVFSGFVMKASLLLRGFIRYVALEYRHTKACPWPMNDKGFTLIELVMVIILVGILAVFVAPRLGTVTGTKADTVADKIRADIRYVQSLAMTMNRRSRVYLNGTGTAPASGYAAVNDTSAAGDCSSFVASTDPAAGGTLSITLNTGTYAGITVTPSMTCLEYDALGRPYDCGAGPATCSSTLGGMTINVNANAVLVDTVTVMAQTGAVN